jgi:FHS family L-fucose permease-like MFS transporter
MTASYALFLFALCLIGLGFSVIQIAANPYVLALGPEKTGSGRLNLAAGFSSVGTTLGPLIGGWLIFRVFARPGEPSLNTVRGPYLVCAAGFGLLILLFSRLRLPQLNSTAPVTRSWGPLAMPAVWLSVLAVFFYVGTEVTIGSSIVNFLGLPAIAGMTHDEASRSLSIYWCGLMAGRFMGAAALSRASPRVKRAALALIPTTALVAVNVAFGWQSALHYALCLVLLVAAFVTGGLSSARLLLLFSVAMMLLLGVGIWTSGATARWAILGTGLFCSIMWSNIFSLALEGLGPLRNQTSALLVMAISGAAILPPLQGALRTDGACRPRSSCHCWRWRMSRCMRGTSIGLPGCPRRSSFQQDPWRLCWLRARYFLVLPIEGRVYIAGMILHGVRYPSEPPNLACAPHQAWEYRWEPENVRQMFMESCV